MKASDFNKPIHRAIIQEETGRNNSVHIKYKQEHKSQSPGRHRIPVLTISSGPLTCTPNHRRSRTATSWGRVWGMVSTSCFMTVRQRRILGDCIWRNKEI